MPTRPEIRSSVHESDVLSGVRQLPAQIAADRAHANRAIDNIASASGHVDGLIVSMRGNVERIASNGARITDGASAIVSNVQDGRGTVGKLLIDEQLAKNIDDTIAKAKQTTTNLEQASGSAKDIVSEFQKENIPEDVHQTVANTRDMSQGLKGGVTDFLLAGSPMKTPRLISERRSTQPVKPRVTWRPTRKR